MSRTRPLVILVVVLGVLAFSAGDAVVKGRHGGTGNAVGNVSATWALVPLLAAALLASGRGARSSAMVGACSTVGALTCYTLVRASWYPDVGGHDVAAMLGNRWLLLGVVGGAVLGVIGEQLSTYRRWGILVALAASLLVMEPVTRMLWALSRGQSARAFLPHPSIWAVEIGCGCLIVLAFVALRVLSSHTR